MTEVFLRRYFLLSHVLLACCIGHVSLRSNGFYDMIVNFLSNKTCVAVLYNYFLMIFAAFCKLPVWLFLGRLSQMEQEQLLESGRNYLMDAVLFLVLSKPRYNGKEIIITDLAKYLTFLVALKSFHILLHIRLSHMFEVEVPSLFKLFRITGFIYTLSMINAYLISLFFADLSTQNTFSIWFLFELFGMLHSCIFCALKYVVHVLDFFYENGKF
ncbi:hypothetical protein BdWA1_002289 [Babesia duncani]|uniref:E3 ubiquitin-protein ligase synoviolin-like TPR repeats domain-containing protein n=1 Tax=Babesia duncani TaxID=323732 RepID=A0AAD9PJG6_9APIC|nr:hypothetical protein BdWA1_002289 [Babesia duncani]